MIRIVFPEYEHPVIKKAISRYKHIQAIKANSLEEACAILNTGGADCMVAGISYTTRDVVTAVRDLVGIKDEVFSSSFLMIKRRKKMLVADAAVTKYPNTKQLFEIIVQTHETAKKLLKEKPRLALLSYSTLGSGGNDTNMTALLDALYLVKKVYPHILIDGEMQLDAAVVPKIGKKKAPESPVAGEANVLICPDLNSGNILYKSMEHFGGWTAAGPILQGFKKPISDLSRGSSVSDVIAVIKAMEKLA